MKTKIYILSLLGGLLLTMGSCLSDGKEDYLDDYKSFLCILNSNEQDITFYNTGEPVTYNITVDKGGNDLDMTASATLKVLNEFDIEYYNSENKTTFKPLPADCYDLPSDMTVSFGEKELYKIKTVTFHPGKISALSTGNFTYVLMLELTDGTSTIHEKNKYIIMKPTVYQPAFSLSESGFKLPFTITEGVNEYAYELLVTLNTALTEDITCDVKVKKELLDEYNATSSIEYSLMPDKGNNYTIGKLTFTKGKVTANLTVKIDITNLEGNFALPLEITSTRYAFSGENTVIIGLQNSAPKITLTPAMMTLIGTDFADGNGFADWLDIDLSTQAQVTYGGGAPAFPHQVDIHLNSAISKLRVRYATRNTNQHPTKFIIYVSNDGTNWKEIKVFTAEADGLPVSATTYYDTCPMMQLGDSYTYVRFEVHSSTNPNKFNTWALSEFELYGK
ncbi:BT_3987 domain-containing protein [Bacteroides congonensis]|uniref:BT_3987 domain-containing protein n=1 Tax=Bacteroides congonensis TaxID=1871006 RepID=UPI00189D330E|nr:DUF1735 domain-containing protein [Bacteroides congonensis]